MPEVGLSVSRLHSPAELANGAQLTRDTIVSLIDMLQVKVGRTKQPCLHLDEKWLDRSSFGSYSTRVGLNYGQAEDRRYPLPGGRGLHEHRYVGFSAFHIDVQDATTRPVQHAVRDTHVLRGSFVGALGALTGIGLVPVLVGALVGSRFPKRPLYPLSYEAAIQLLDSSPPEIGG